MPQPVAHPDRKEIARYLLSRGLEFEPLRHPPAAEEGRVALAPRLGDIPFPDSAPAPAPLSGTPAPGDALPHADVVVITWTADEARALAHCFTPGMSFEAWYPYDRHYADHYEPLIRPGAPARMAKRLARYMPTMVGDRSVLCVKSELHLNQDGIEDKDAHGKGLGTATLPVKDFLGQLIAETGAGYVFTIGTAGSVVARVWPRRCRRDPRRSISLPAGVRQRAVQSHHLQE